MNNLNFTKLNNGVRILSENIPYVQSFSLGFWFNVGSRDESLKNNGISHFIEHMLFKGTKTRTAKKIAAEIESLGGYLNAFTSKEHTCFYGRGLSQHLSKTYQVLADMILNPSFKPRDIEREASVVVDELNDIEDSPEELIFDKLEGNIYRKNTLGMPIIGTETNIKKFIPGDLFEFITKHYGMNKLYVVASGNLNHDTLVRLTERHFSKNNSLSNNKRKKLKLGSHDSLHLKKEIQQTHVLMGQPTFGIKSAEKIKVNILSHILGEGSSSRLFQSLREKNGIAYQINSFVNAFYDVSTFGIYFSTNGKSAKRADSLIRNEFEKLRSNKVSNAELTRAKEYLKGNILMSLESTTNRMIRMAQSMIYLKRIKPIDEVISDIRAVDGEDILKLANQILFENSFNKVTISS